MSWGPWDLIDQGRVPCLTQGMLALGHIDGSGHDWGGVLSLFAHLNEDFGNRYAALVEIMSLVGVASRSWYPRYGSDRHNRGRHGHLSLGVRFALDDQSDSDWWSER